MADIKQRIVVDGADQAKAQFAQIGQAGKDAFGAVSDAAARSGDVAKNFNFDAARQQVVDLVNAARQLLSTFDQVAAGATSASAAIRSLGTDAKSAAGETNATSSAFASIATKATIAAGSIAGIGAAIFAAAKQAAAGAKEIGDAAEASGASLDGFQKGKFVFEQMGADSKTAEAAIKSFSDKAKESIGAAADRLAQLGFRFAGTEEGVNAAKQAIERMGGANAALDPLVEKLRSIGIVVAPGAEQLKNITEIARSLGLAGSDGLKKLKDETPDVVARLRDLATVIAAMGDETTQKAAAAAAGLGDELGPKFVEKLRESPQALEEFLKDFQALGLGITQDSIDLSTTFNAAMSRFTTASQTARIEFGSRFLPIVTEGIRLFTNLLRLNKGPIDDWAKSTAESFKQVAADIFTIFSGTGGEIKTGWLSTIRDLVEGVVIPALKGLVAAAQPVLDKINELFGTKITAGGAAIVAVLTAMLGGFNALALAVVALATGSSPLLDKFRAGLSGIGVDFGSIKKFASEAFAQIKALFSSQGTFSTPFGQFKLDASVLAETILAIVAAFVILRKTGELVAPVLSAVVGRSISGEAVVFSGVLAQLTGVASALEGVMIGVAAATTIFRNVFAGAIVLLQGAAAVVGWPIVLAAGITIAILNFKQFAAILDPIAKALNSLFGTEFFSGVGLAGAAVATLAVAFVTRLGLVSKAVALLRAGIVAVGLEGAVALLPLTVIFATIGAAAAVALALVDGGFRKTLVGGAGALFNKLKDLAGAGSLDELKGKLGLVGDQGKKAADDTGSAFDALLEKLRGFASGNVDPTAKLTAGADALANKAQAVGTVLGDFKKTSADTWSFIGDGAKAAGDKVGEITKSLGDEGGKFQSFGDRIKAAFGEVAKQTDQVNQATPGLGAALEAIGGKLDGLKQKAADVGDAIRAAFAFLNPISSASAAEGQGTLTGADQAGGGAGAGASLVAPFQAAAEQIKQVWGELVAFITNPDTYIGIGLATGSIAEAFASLSALLQEMFAAATEIIIADLERIAAQVQSVLDSIAQAQAAASASSSSSSDITAGTGATFAGGGFVRGPGTTTSDSILAWLSDREFVQPARSVMQYGRDFMEAIRSGALPASAVRSLMAGMRGFAGGGLVERYALALAPVPIPRFADGGAVAAGASASLAPVHFHFSDGRSAVLFGGSSAIDELSRKASSDLISATGASPRWRRR